MLPSLCCFGMAVKLVWGKGWQKVFQLLRLCAWRRQWDCSPFLSLLHAGYEVGSSAPPPAPHHDVLSHHTTESKGSTDQYGNLQTHGTRLIHFLSLDLFHVSTRVTKLTAEGAIQVLRGPFRALWKILVPVHSAHPTPDTLQGQGEGKTVSNWQVASLLLDSNLSSSKWLVLNC